MSALKAWAPAGHVYAWWVGETLYVGSMLGDLVAAERSGPRWRIYDDLSDEQIGVIDGRASRAEVVKIVETLWSTTLRVTDVRAGSVTARNSRSG